MTLQQIARGMTGVGLILIIAALLSLPSTEADAKKKSARQKRVEACLNGCDNAWLARFDACQRGGAITRVCEQRAWRIRSECRDACASIP